jgi:FPC/CPF motif-containing protein YcgG
MRHGAKWLLFITILGASLPDFAAEPSELPWDCAAGRASVSKGAKRLKVTEAIALASTAAKKKGFDLARFQQSSICFDTSKERGSWVVFFDGREPRPGNHFLVEVRDDTGATDVMPGQ